MLLDPCTLLDRTDFGRYLFTDLLVPWVKNFLDSIPHLYQTPGGKLELKMIIKHLEDLGKGIAQAIMKPSG